MIFLENVEWLSYLRFFVDITEVLDKLQFHLQGKGYCFSIFERMISLKNTLELFITQLKTCKITHFYSLSERGKICSV